MATERRQELLLGAAVAVLALIVYRLWPTSTPAAPSTRPAVRTQTSPSARATPAPGASAGTGLDVHLYALGEERPRPINAERNLFRFKPKPLPPPPPSPPVALPPPINVAPSGLPPPPPVPPIGYKFIGVVEAPAQAAKIAILSDKDHNVFHGREGDIIEGRYRILRIGAESIEMAYLDGRGRQTIRLTGS
jgi:hypothetical protein